MTKLYIDKTVYDTKKDEILDRLNVYYEDGIIPLPVVVNLMCLVYDMASEGLVGDVEIFKEVRDQIMEERTI